MMKPSNVSLVSLCLLCLAGCSDVAYSFRVTEAFPPAGSVAPGPGTLPGVLAPEGDIPGVPVGDRYETLGLVSASQGAITVHGGQIDSRIRLIGRDLEVGESPTAAIIIFDSACVHVVGTGVCLPGASSPLVTFTVRDEAGNIGLAFTISGGFVHLSLIHI